MADTYFGQLIEKWDDCEDSTLRPGLTLVDTNALGSIPNTGWFRSGAASFRVQNTARTAPTYIQQAPVAAASRFGFWYRPLSLSAGWIDDRVFCNIGSNDDIGMVRIYDVRPGTRQFDCVIGGASQTPLALVEGNDYFFSIRIVDQVSCSIRVSDSSGTTLIDWTGTLPGWTSVAWVRVGQCHSTAAVGETCYIDDILYDDTNPGFLTGWSSGPTPVNGTSTQSQDRQTQASTGTVGSVTYTISDVTRDNSGAVLGSCQVSLFKHTGAGVFTYVATTTSNATTGVFSFTLTDNDSAYMLYAHHAGTPNVFDCSDRNLTPV